MKNNRNKVAIYVFWEKNGIVREYVITYLKGLKKVADTIYVVVNGVIREEDKLRIENMSGIIVIKRPNEGVDFWAYKAAIDSIGNKINDYEQIILCNCSCYGPIYPFEHMFNEMNKKNIDFWGITEWPLNEGGFKGTWIQSYFIVLNKNVFLSNQWNNYWENLCPVNSREEAIKLHEMKFTQYFADSGFEYDVYCHNTRDYIDLTIEAPDKLVIDMKCPIIKRKVFCIEYNRFLTYHRGVASKKVFNYIKENNLYNVNFILDDILATQHYAYIKDCLNLNYVLSSQYSNFNSTSKKVIVCFHICYENLLEISFNYIKNIPDYIDLFITTSKKELLSKIEEKIARYNIKNVKVDLISKQGKAESAFLVATKNFILDYDYACVVHDEEFNFIRPGCIGKEFNLYNLEALLGSRQYINNIIELFENNSRIGMLEPINLMYAHYRNLYGNEWGKNYEGTVDFLRKEKIDVPISKKVAPIFPAGGMFWFRPIALKKMIELDLKYTDFPSEPVKTEGSLLQIIRRAYPYFIQEAGFLIGWVSDNKNIENHITNLAYLFRKVSLENKEQFFVSNKLLIKILCKRILSKYLPLKIYNMIKKSYIIFRK